LYNKYCSLLVSAAQQHDQQLFGKQDHVAKWQIYEHDEELNYDTNKFSTAEYDINQLLDFLQIHATHYNQGPRLTYEQWHALPDDAKKIWGTLSQEATTIIL